MDGIPAPPAQPTVQIIKKSFLETKIGKALLICISITLFIIFIVGLNYFNVLSPNISGTPVKITLVPENYGFKAGELTLGCPVESAFCKSQKLVNLQNIDTVAYKAASNSGVINVTEITSPDNIGILTDRKAGKKYLYESIVSADGASCYTIAYTLPQDAVFQNILDLEIINKGHLAILGSKTFQLEGRDANVLIQIRSTPMDPGKACSLLQKSPEFFKNF